MWDLVPTATVEHATHVFPCPDGFERPDLKLPIHLPAVYAQYTPQVVSRRGDRRSMWRGFAELGSRLGVSILPDGLDPNGLTDDDVLGMQLAGTPVDWDAVREAAQPVPYPKVDNWVVEHVPPDGRWDLAPDPLVDQLSESLEPPGHRRPTHDLVLANRREVRHTNSLLTRGVDGAPGPEPYVYAHPLDAKAATVAGGDWVEITSHRRRRSGGTPTPSPSIQPLIPGLLQSTSSE